MMNTRLICYLLLNTIDEFLVSRFVNVKRVQYKDLTLLRTYCCQNPMTATQTHRQIIVLLVHQVIMHQIVIIVMSSIWR
jgi:hypothetical protein